MRKIFLALALVVCAVSIQASNPRDDFKKNVKMSGANYWEYPYLTAPTPQLSPAPKGYTPFYINHYGRHGSRWLITPAQYNFPIQELEKAERNGKLTEIGKKTLAILRDVYAKSAGRLGELTDKGADQHRGIAQRMYRNFPDVFAGDAKVEARSTIIIRCILSMENALQELKALNPKLNIFHDASEHDMYFMNYNDTAIVNLRKAALPTVTAWEKKHAPTERLMQSLVSDKKFIADSIDSFKFSTYLFDVACNQQSHYDMPDLYSVFTDDEVYDFWTLKNVYWYMVSGKSLLTNSRAPYQQLNLLKNFIETADVAVADGKNCATLRFGHESVLLPLLCLMDVNGAGQVIENLDEVSTHWQDYKYFPMACNLQMVFYKKEGSSDVLVKLLLNEAEATLPIKTNCAPYYHWSDVRAYLTKIAYVK